MQILNGRWPLSATGCARVLVTCRTVVAISFCDARFVNFLSRLPFICSLIGLNCCLLFLSLFRRCSVDDGRGGEVICCIIHSASRSFWCVAGPAHAVQQCIPLSMIMALSWLLIPCGTALNPVASLCCLASCLSAFCWSSVMVGCSFFSWFGILKSTRVSAPHVLHLLVPFLSVGPWYRCEGGAWYSFFSRL